MGGGRLKWQSYRIIATRLVIIGCIAAFPREISASAMWPFVKILYLLPSSSTLSSNAVAYVKYNAIMLYRFYGGPYYR